MFNAIAQQRNKLESTKHKAIYSPDQKIEHVRRLLAAYGHVGMIGYNENAHRCNHSLGLRPWKGIAVVPERKREPSLDRTKVTPYPANC